MLLWLMILNILGQSPDDRPLQALYLLLFTVTLQACRAFLKLICFLRCQRTKATEYKVWATLLSHTPTREWERREAGKAAAQEHSFPLQVIYSADSHPLI